MSILESVLDFLYGKNNSILCDSIKNELDEYQSFLEKNGFKVQRGKQLVNYEAAQCLTAEKGNVVLTANRFLNGGRDLSIRLKHRGYATIVPLFPAKLAETVAVVNASHNIR